MRRWNFDNIAVKTNKASNLTFQKGKSSDSIDGDGDVAAAVARCAARSTSQSIYDSAEWSVDMAFA